MMASSTPDVKIKMTCEPIEVTRDGTLPPYKASVWREFIPGPMNYHAIIDGTRLRITREQAHEGWEAIQTREQTVIDAWVASL